MGTLNNKGIVVTGASSGIGRAAARRFHDQGARLLLVARGGERLRETADELGPSVTAVAADVSREDGVQAVVEAAGDLGPVHGLYHNAGTAPFVPIEAVTAELFDSCMHTNVLSAVRLTAGLSQLMSPGAAILLTGSAMHHRPLPSGALWAASTTALVGLAKALAVELADRQIRVNIISHGPVDTPIYAQYGMPDDRLQALKDQLGAGTLVGRMGTVDQVAAVAATLLACGGFANGSEVLVDGGWALKPA